MTAADEVRKEAAFPREYRIGGAGKEIGQADVIRGKDRLRELIVRDKAGGAVTGRRKTCTSSLMLHTRK